MKKSIQLILSILILLMTSSTFAGTPLIAWGTRANEAKAMILKDLNMKLISGEQQKLEVRSGKLQYNYYFTDFKLSMIEIVSTDTDFEEFKKNYAKLKVMLQATPAFSLKNEIKSMTDDEISDKDKALATGKAILVNFMNTGDSLVSIIGRIHRNEKDGLTYVVTLKMVPNTDED